MIKAKLEDVNTLKKLLESIKEIVEDVNMDVSKDGIFVQALDSSHVSLVSCGIKKAAFSDYSCDPMCMGIKTKALWSICKQLSSSDTCSPVCATLASSSSGDTLDIVLKSKDRQCDFSLKLMDIDSEHLGIPESEPDVVIKMSSSEFANMCKEFALVGENVAIKVSKPNRNVQFFVAGDLYSGGLTLSESFSGDSETLPTATAAEKKTAKKRKANSMEENENEGEEGEKEVLGDAKSSSKNKNVGGPPAVTIAFGDQFEGEELEMSFALKFLCLFSKGAILDDQVCLCIQKDMPLCVKFVSAKNHTFTSFYLAPKLSESDL